MHVQWRRAQGLLEDVAAGVLLELDPQGEAVAVEHGSLNEP